MFFIIVVLKIYVKANKENVSSVNCRTEKDACAWSQDKIKGLFKGSIIEGDGCKYIAIFIISTYFY